MPDRQHRESVFARPQNYGWIRDSLLSVVSTLVLSSVCHAAPIDVELAYTFDDNITRAEREVDIFDDQFVSLQVGSTFLQWLNQNNRLIYRGFVRGEFYDQYDKLSNVTAGINVTYQYRASGVFTAPTYAAFVKTAIAEYKSEIRDSNLYSAGVSLRKPFTDRIVYTAMLSFNKRDSDSTVFDTSEISLLQNIDYKLGERWTTYFTYNYIDGDITSTATPYLKVVNAAETINADDAFGGTGANRFVYRLDAKTNVMTLGANFTVNEKNSIDASVRWVESKASVGDIKYERWIVSAAYLTRF